ncbi:MAG: RNA polymerase sigma factor [Wenzhouxiangella sp.]
MALSADELEAAYRRLERPMYNYLYRWFWDAAQCEDLIHDAFERLWKSRRRIDANSLDALAWTTIINLARNHHAARKRWRWLPLPPALMASDDPGQALELDWRDRRLRDALDQLPIRSREVLLLELFSGLSRVEIAHHLGIVEGTLASRKHQAVARIQALLQEPET